MKKPQFVFCGALSFVFRINVINQKDFKLKTLANAFKNVSMNIEKNVIKRQNEKMFQC